MSGYFEAFKIERYSFVLSSVRALEIKFKNYRSAPITAWLASFNLCIRQQHRQGDMQLKIPYNHTRFKYIFASRNIAIKWTMVRSHKV